MPIAPTIPRSTVGAPNGNYIPRLKPVGESEVFTMRSPDGELHEVSRQNVGDMLKNHGWEHHNVAAENPAPSDAASEEEEGVAPAIVQPEDKPAETDPEKMNELEKLRHDFKQLTGDEADKRWGKRVLQLKLDAALEQPVTDESEAEEVA